MGLLFLTVYLTSTVLTYCLVYFYAKSGGKIGMSQVIYVLTPLVNTYCLLNWVFWRIHTEIRIKIATLNSKRKDYRTFPEKFFRVRKE